MLYQVLGNGLRTFDLDNVDLDDDDPFEPYCTATAYAIRCTYHTTLGASPGQLVFGRDMMLPVRYNVDWYAITRRKQARINASNRRENKSRLNHSYQVGDWIIVQKPGIIRKLSVPQHGPYQVERVHEDNGTLTIRKSQYTTDRLNMRRCQPFYHKDAIDNEE